MQILVTGSNHASATIELRERIAFRQEALDHALRDITSASQPAVKEAVILSTCNRTELYLATERPHEALSWLARYHQLDVDGIAPHIYSLADRQAVQQALRVAAGLDSMVLGEPQILGQVKHAVKIAEQAGTLGTLLHKLFQHAFSVAKEVRSNTGIGMCSVSMAAATVKLAQNMFGDLKPLNMLFIGAGEMITLCAEHFSAHRPNRMTIANRTMARAATLAKRIGAQTIPLNALPGQLAGFDVVITSTASQLPILNLDMLQSIPLACRPRPMLVIDLAVPRDIEPAVGRLDQVRLYTIDDLADMVQSGMSQRQQAVADAESIIALQTESFMQWLDARAAVPTICALREQAERMRQDALAKAHRKLASGAEPTRVVEALSRALTNKLLHGPSHALKRHHNRDQDQFDALLRELYRI